MKKKHLKSGIGWKVGKTIFFKKFELVTGNIFFYLQPKDARSNVVQVSWSQTWKASLWNTKKCEKLMFDV